MGVDSGDASSEASGGAKPAAAGDPLAALVPAGRIATLPRGLESFGTVVDFLAQRPPFDRHALGPFSRAIRRQVTRGEHVAALDGARLVGYIGWLPTSRAVAEAWLAGAATLVPVEDADAVVLTMVAVARDGVLLPLIRAARERDRARKIYFKRSYTGSARRERKSVVYNVSFTGNIFSPPPFPLR